MGTAISVEGSSPRGPAEDSDLSFAISKSKEAWRQLLLSSSSTSGGGINTLAVHMKASLSSRELSDDYMETCLFHRRHDETPVFMLMLRFIFAIDDDSVQTRARLKLIRDEHSSRGVPLALVPVFLDATLDTFVSILDSTFLTDETIEHLKRFFGFIALEMTGTSASLESNTSRSIVGWLQSSSSRDQLVVGDEVQVASLALKGVVRFIGMLPNQSSVHVGIELKHPGGTCDGSVGGATYFECMPLHGILIPQAKCSRINKSAK